MPRGGGSLAHAGHLRVLLRCNQLPQHAVVRPLRAVVFFLALTAATNQEAAVQIAKSEELQEAAIAKKIHPEAQEAALPADNYIDQPQPAASPPAAVPSRGCTVHTTHSPAPDPANRQETRPQATPNPSPPPCLFCIVFATFTFPNPEGFMPDTGR